ncbi:MAG: hypothetical protein CAPSK01_001255 [Candidatus Accumulibacter vicinus]|uniref:Uncharacterized protein n=2 Tax=Candidatus Accumulibacter vicinus TaxID=2954382 RepID=A0A084Y2X0_9PROT|nr:MAG: hypothetical protein CAPSK01_001255 [Candidatus Accumulibacter vicinus]
MLTRIERRDTGADALETIPYKLLTKRRRLLIVCLHSTVKLLTVALPSAVINGTAGCLWKGEHKMNVPCSSRLGLLAVLTVLGGSPAMAGEWQNPPRPTAYIGEVRQYDAGERHYPPERYHVAPAPWNGQFRGGDIDARQERQRARIWQGWQSGQLTRGEMRELMAEQRAIFAKERAYLADGYLSRREYADLQNDLEYASRRIYHSKHDSDWRGHRYGE